MKKASILFVLFIISMIIPAQMSGSTKERLDLPGKTAQYFMDINRDYGIEIITNVNAMIPGNWVASPINGKAKALDEIYYEKTAKAISKALSVYPKNFLDDQLHGISLVSHLEFYGVEYGGTAVYEYRTIILEIKEWSSEKWIIGTIHHELNHLLVYWNDFPESRWKSLNKSGFKYGNGGADAIKNGQSSTTRDEKSLRDGFANQYGKSAYVEDIATIAEFAISDRDDFQKRAMKYPIISNKFSVLKDFYHKLNPDIDDEFWTGINKEDKNDVINIDNVRDSSEALIEDMTGPEIKFYSYLDPYAYKERFSKNDTYIAYYFELDNSKTSYDSVDVRAVYYYPDGSKVGEFMKTYSSKKDNITCSWGFGWKDPGNWISGKYKVELYVNDDFFSNGYFYVR